MLDNAATQSRSPSLLEQIKDLMLGALVLVLGLLWVFGGLIGAIIEATRDDLIGVVLAVMIPGYGAFVTLIAMLKAVF